jgi:hypothetical protein
MSTRKEFEKELIEKYKKSTQFLYDSQGSLYIKWLESKLEDKSVVKVSEVNSWEALLSNKYNPIYSGGNAFTGSIYNSLRTTTRASEV